MKRNEVVDLLQMNYQRIKDGKGKWFDKRVAYTIARSFVSEEHQFSDKDYRQMEKTLQGELKLFNALGQPVRGMLLGMLLANGKSKDLDIHILITDYQRLRDAGFHSSSFSYFTAYLLQFIETAEKEFIVRRGQEIYAELKANHYFLTGAEDGAIAISLAQHDKLETLTPKQIGNLVETYYQALNAYGFRKNKSTAICCSDCGNVDGLFFSAYD
ncbi:DUF4003 family protein [Candidatus Enterococcus ikei]|uniref:DUF4003 family protein n=1 Tax=Candidatus Enterococcus ikei TaxID=2815326 RepID=UPI0024142603|nr:DUF4003 family protein [Enterococcus sp. DIV0869a]